MEIFIWISAMNKKVCITFLASGPVLQALAIAFLPLLFLCGFVPKVKLFFILLKGSLRIVWNCLNILENFEIFDKYGKFLESFKMFENVSFFGPEAWTKVFFSLVGIVLNYDLSTDSEYFFLPRKNPCCIFFHKIDKLEKKSAFFNKNAKKICESWNNFTV